MEKFGKFFKMFGIKGTAESEVVLRMGSVCPSMSTLTTITKLLNLSSFDVCFKVNIVCSLLNLIDVQKLAKQNGNKHWTLENKKPFNNLQITEKEIKGLKFYQMKQAKLS